MRTALLQHGPFRAEQLRSGDPYELSNGHPIHCAPTGGAGSGANALGASVVAWDPAVEEVGVDAGYAPTPGTLRAPDVAVGNVPNAPGWIAGVPSLAIEYADAGQDEESLKEKIADLLGAGTRFLWVVRLTGPRRVEVHRPNEPMKLAHPGEVLVAEGVLRNPVPVEALYDRRAAEQATLRNLLQRQGYADLDAAIAEGEEQGRAEGRTEGEAHGLAEGRMDGLATAILTLLAARGIAVPDEARGRIAGCRDRETLDRYLVRAASAAALGDVLG